MRPFMKVRPLAFYLAAALLSCLLLVGAPAAFASPNVGDVSGQMSLNCDTLELEITSEDPRPMAYLYVEDDYYFIIWSSSDPTVATVDSDGKVNGRSAGTAVITARTDRGEKASCTVTVTQNAEVVTQAALNQSSMQLVIQYDHPNPSQPLYLINRKDSPAYVYQWHSNNPAVAAVSANGVVTAQSEGEAVITALTSLGQSLTCKVRVSSDVGKVVLNKTNLPLLPGSSERLSAVVLAEGVVPVTWVSSNPGVATVNAEGKVTAVAEGEATVTALSPEGRSAECLVKVALPANPLLAAALR